MRGMLSGINPYRVIVERAEHSLELQSKGLDSENHIENSKFAEQCWVDRYRHGFDFILCHGAGIDPRGR